LDRSVLTVRTIDLAVQFRRDMSILPDIRGVAQPG
jgi:hypothetical protein